MVDGRTESHPLRATERPSGPDAPMGPPPFDTRDLCGARTPVERRSVGCLPATTAAEGRGEDLYLAGATDRVALGYGVDVCGWLNPSVQFECFGVYHDLLIQHGPRSTSFGEDPVIIPCWMIGVPEPIYHPHLDGVVVRIPEFPSHGCRMLFCPERSAAVPAEALA